MAKRVKKLFRRCAITIGVNKVGRLPILSAAASSATEFATWAATQNIKVVALTDEGGKQVKLSDIKNAIHQFVQEKVYDQLIVFFAGHGILKAPLSELWLLSRALEDVNEAVNVAEAIAMSRAVGIPHIIFISDACRSIPNNFHLSQAQGGAIFPSERTNQTSAFVDVFYATMPGDPAAETSFKSAVRNYGVFTKFLMDGLEGKVPEVLVPNQDQEDQELVPAWELKLYLDENIPQEAAKINIKIAQFPDIRVESRLPMYLAEFSAQNLPTPKTDNIPLPTKTWINKLKQKFLKPSIDRYYQHLRREFDFQNELMENYSDYKKVDSLFHESSTKDDASDFYLSTKKLLDTKGRKRFETKTGFTIVGATPARVLGPETQYDVFEEQGRFQIRTNKGQSNKNSEQSNTLLLQFSDGSGIPLAILPGFVGTVVVEAGRIVNITYIPSQDTNNYREYIKVARQVDTQRAIAAIASRNGVFRFDGRLESKQNAAILRKYKHLDPTLGLYAAYAYFQGGDSASVASVHRYMNRRDMPLLFDVALLESWFRKVESPFRQPFKGLAPFCPVLTQGWALLNPLEEIISPVVLRAGRELIPGLWTTFNKSGMELLWSEFQKGVNL